MRSLKSMMMSGALLFGFAMCFTSCEGTLDDIFGEWDKPSGGGSSTINATSLSITEALLRLDKSAPTPQALTLNVTPADATITWKSMDETVATVDASGNVTPKKAGTVTIKATSGDKEDACKVYVYDKIWNINTDGAAGVTAGENWLIEGNGTAIDNNISIGSGAKVTLKDINITYHITCLGDATIILADGSMNTVTIGSSGAPGILVGGSGTTLTINGETLGTGKLIATGGSNGGAGIGTAIANSSDNVGGKITINGGKITATGGVGAAGIGTGKADKHNNSCGAITINGGEITATGQNGGAGIGTGKASDAGNTCGAITITGGMVNATGGSCGAGIGAGYSYQYSGTAIQTCGDISITADVTSVTATKGSSSPNSIGKGLAGGGTQICGTITIDPSANVTEN